MKAQLFCVVVLCLLASALAGPVSVHVRSKRSAACPTCPTPSPAPQPPWGNGPHCPGLPNLVLGLLITILYLLLNLTINLTAIITICIQINALGLLRLLWGLLGELSAACGGLPGAITLVQLNIQIALCITIVAKIIAVIDVILGPGTGRAMACTKPTGAYGLVATIAINATAIVVGRLGQVIAAVGLINLIISLLLSIMTTIVIVL